MSASAARAARTAGPVFFGVVPFSAYCLTVGGSNALAVAYFFALGFATYAVAPMAWAILGLVILLGLPGEAHILFTGISYMESTGQVNLHGLTYFTVGGVIALALVRPAHIPIHDRTPRKQAAVFAILLGLEGAIEVLGVRNGLGPSNQLPDVYLGPILFYFLLLSLLTTARRIEALRTTFLIVTTILAGYGVVEFLSGHNGYLADQLIRQDISWYWSFRTEASYGGAYRVMTTLGHPLTNAAYFLVAFAMVIFVPSKTAVGMILRTAGAVLLVTGLILTFSRGAFVLAGVAVAWYGLGSGRKGTLVRVAALVTLLPLAYVFLQPAIELLLGRGFSLYESSASQRVSTLVGLSRNVGQLTFLGYGPQGVEAASVLLLERFATSSLEIGYVIVLLQYGFVFLALYLYGIFLGFRDRVLPWSRSRRSERAPFLPSVLLVMVYFAGSNTIGVRSTINYLMFFALALHVSWELLHETPDTGSNLST